MSEPSAPPIAPNFDRYAAQATLFAERPPRLGLLKLAEAPARRRMRANVWRNHAFEAVASLVQPYLAFGELAIDFSLGDYDDSLDFSRRPDADLDLVWLDSSRYLARMTAGEWVAWLGDRLQALRRLSAAPIIIATWIDDPAAASLAAAVDAVPGARWADLQAACREHGVDLIDRRTQDVAGTPVGSVAALLLARELGGRWLPAALLPPVKAIAVDLDNTLHSGVLGEDGPAGVVLTDGHRQLQSALRSLREAGVFLALVSRNERADVEDLFARREDYPLRWDHFSSTEISWGDKADALARIAAALRIAPDAMAFVDDNVGELAAVSSRLPGIQTVFASPDAMTTARALRYLPGLWRWTADATDAIRIRDLQANAERDALAASTADPGDYFRSLQARLVFRPRDVANLARLADLCRKTNQFNLALRRLNEAELAHWATAPRQDVVSVQLSDRLADSGIIAVLALTRDDDVLRVDELCISCRALGRKLENTIIFLALRASPLFAGCRRVEFRYDAGPRNQPARDWLAIAAGQAGLDGEAGTLRLDASVAAGFEPAAGVLLDLPDQT